MMSQEIGGTSRLMRKDRKGGGELLVGKGVGIVGTGHSAMGITHLYGIDP